MKACFSIGRSGRKPLGENRRTPDLSRRRLRLAAASLLLSAVVVLPSTAAFGAAAAAEWFEFRGQVVIPSTAVLRGKRITLTLLDVRTAFNARTRADSSGHFRFKEIPSGIYSLFILIPGAGELRSTVDVTAAFADAEGRVEKRFTFDAGELAHDARPVERGMVSVRELSIPRKARNEYSAARNDLQRQKTESARRHLEQAVEFAPQFMEALNYLGVLAFQRGDFASSEDYFRKALEQDPEAFEPLVNLGGALLALGRTREALEVNLRAQTARPRDALANAQLGLSYYLLEDDGPALNYLLLTEQIDPAHFTYPQLALADIYLRNSEEESAFEELEEFLEHHPDSPQAESARAMMRKIREAREPESATAVRD